MKRRLSVGVSFAFLGALYGCGSHDQDPAAVGASPSPFKISTSIQDIMRHEIEPSAEALWDSVAP